MPWHNWSDNNFDWELLYEAQSFIVTAYRRLTGHHMRTKEKYGTIRYESTYLWIKSDNDSKRFREVLQLAVKKFPKVAGELVDDAIHLTDDEFFSGWCAGVMYLSTGDFWKSDKKPRGI